MTTHAYRTPARPAPRAKRLHRDPVALARRTEMVNLHLDRLGAVEAVRAVIRGHGCLEIEVLGGDCHRTPARCRRHVWMLLRHTLGLSYPELARVFDMDHSTILVGIRQAEAELEGSSA